MKETIRRRFSIFVTIILAGMLTISLSSCGKEKASEDVGDIEEITKQGREVFSMEGGLLFPSPEGYTADDAYYLESNNGAPATISFKKNADKKTTIDMFYTSKEGFNYEEAKALAEKKKEENVVYGEIETDIGTMVYKKVTTPTEVKVQVDGEEVQTAIPEIYGIMPLEEGYITVNLFRQIYDEESMVTIYEPMTDNDFEDFRRFIESIKAN